MENEKKEKIKAKARRLLEMAKRGSNEAERSNAQRRLDDLLRKNNIQLAEIDISLNDRFFNVESEEDKTILMNSILSLNPFTKMTCEKKFISASLDDEDYAEVKSKFSYFTKLFRVEKELLIMAFFGKHDVFFKPNEKAKSKFRDAEKKTNSAFEMAKKEREDLQKKADANMNHQAEKEFKTQSSQSDFDISDKDAEIKKIKILNLSRLSMMQNIMLDAKYVQSDRSIEEKNN